MWPARKKHPNVSCHHVSGLANQAERCQHLSKGSEKPEDTHKKDDEIVVKIENVEGAEHPESTIKLKKCFVLLEKNEEAERKAVQSDYISHSTNRPSLQHGKNCINEVSTVKEENVSDSIVDNVDIKTELPDNADKESNINGHCRNTRDNFTPLNGRIDDGEIKLESSCGTPLNTTGETNDGEATLDGSRVSPIVVCLFRNLAQTDQPVRTVPPTVQNCCEYCLDRFKSKTEWKAHVVKCRRSMPYSARSVESNREREKRKTAYSRENVTRVGVHPSVGTTSAKGYTKGEKRKRTDPNKNVTIHEPVESNESLTTTHKQPVARLGLTKNANGQKKKRYDSNKNMKKPDLQPVVRLSAIENITNTKTEVRKRVEALKNMTTAGKKGTILKSKGFSRFKKGPRPRFRVTLEKPTKAKGVSKIGKTVNNVKAVNLSGMGMTAKGGKAKHVKVVLSDIGYAKTGKTVNRVNPADLTSIDDTEQCGNADEMPLNLTCENVEETQSDFRNDSRKRTVIFCEYCNATFGSKTEKQAHTVKCRQHSGSHSAKRPKLRAVPWKSRNNFFLSHSFKGIPSSKSVNGKTTLDKDKANEVKNPHTVKEKSRAFVSEQDEETESLEDGSQTAERPGSSNQEGSSKRAEARQEKRSKVIKEHCCYYCSKMTQNLKSHLRTNHFARPAVQKIIFGTNHRFAVRRFNSKPKDSGSGESDDSTESSFPELQRRWIERLRNLGDFVHNCSALEMNQSSLITKYGRKRSESYLPCVLCYTFLQGYTVVLHLKNCRALQSGSNILRRLRNFSDEKYVLSCKCLLYGATGDSLLQSSMDTFDRHIVKGLEENENGMVALNDPLIRKLGLVLLKEQGEVRAGDIVEQLKVFGELLDALQKESDQGTSGELLDALQKESDQGTSGELLDALQKESDQGTSGELLDALQKESDQGTSGELLDALQKELDQGTSGELLDALQKELDQGTSGELLDALQKESDQGTSGELLDALQKETNQGTSGEVLCTLQKDQEAELPGTMQRDQGRDDPSGELLGTMQKDQGRDDPSGELMGTMQKKVANQGTDGMKQFITKKMFGKIVYGIKYICSEKAQQFSYSVLEDLEMMSLMKKGEAIRNRDDQGCRDAEGFLLLCRMNMHVAILCEGTAGSLKTVDWENFLHDPMDDLPETVNKGNESRSNCADTGDNITRETSNNKDKLPNNNGENITPAEKQNIPGEETELFQDEDHISQSDTNKPTLGISAGSGETAEDGYSSDDMNEDDIEDGDYVYNDDDNADDMSVLNTNMSMTHNCYFCNQLTADLTCHFNSHHWNEPEIKKVFTPKSAMRKLPKDKRQALHLKKSKEVQRLRNYGDFLHNVKVIERNKGILVTRVGKNAKMSCYTPCVYCCLFVQNVCLTYHFNIFHKDDKDVPEQLHGMSEAWFVKACQWMFSGATGVALFKHIHGKFRKCVVKKLEAKNAGIIALQDPFIYKLGLIQLKELLLKEDLSDNFDDILSQLEIFGKLLYVLRKNVDQSTIGIEEFLTKGKFDLLVNGVGAVCQGTGKDSKLVITDLLEVMAVVKKGDALKNQEEEKKVDAECFIQFYRENRPTLFDYEGGGDIVMREEWIQYLDGVPSTETLLVYNQVESLWSKAAIGSGDGNNDSTEGTDGGMPCDTDLAEDIPMEDDQSKQPTGKQQTGLYTDTNIYNALTDKPHSCYFCSELFKMSKLLDHFERHHTTEPEVKKIILEKQRWEAKKHRGKKKERKNHDVDKLKTLGDFIHNVKAIEKNEGMLLTKYGKNTTASSYMPCICCYTFVQKTLIQVHLRNGHKGETDIPESFSKMSAEWFQKACYWMFYGATGNGLLRSNDGKFLKFIVQELKKDELGTMALQDPIIYKLGQVLLKEKGTNRADEICEMLGLMGRLLELLRKQANDGTAGIEKFLAKDWFESVIRKVGAVSTHLDTELRLEAAGLLEQMAVLKIGLSMKRKQKSGKEEAEGFIQLYQQRTHVSLMFENDTSCQEDVEFKVTGVPPIDKELKVATQSSKKTKWHFCPFCREMTMGMSLHLQRSHRTEPEVQCMPKFPPDKDLLAEEEIAAIQSKRDEVAKRLRDLGDFLNNIRAIRRRKGMLIAKLKHNKPLSQDFLPCSHCLIFYAKHHAVGHMKLCTSVSDSEENLIPVERLFLTESLLLLLGAGGQGLVENLMKEYDEYVLQGLGDDRIDDFIKTEVLMTKLGMALLDERGSQHADAILGELRDFSKVLIELLDDPIFAETQVENLVSMKNLNFCLEALDAMCGEDSDPAKLLQTADMFDKLAQIKRGAAIREKDRETEIDALKVIETLRKRRRRKLRLLQTQGSEEGQTEVLSPPLIIFTPRTAEENQNQASMIRDVKSRKKRGTYCKIKVIKSDTVSNKRTKRTKPMIPLLQKTAEIPPVKRHLVDTETGELVESRDLDDPGETHVNLTETNLNKTDQEPRKHQTSTSCSLKEIEVQPLSAQRDPSFTDRNWCGFCGKSQPWLIGHLRRYHRNAPDVLNIPKLPSKNAVMSEEDLAVISKDRRNALLKHRNLCVFFQNVATIQAQEGVLVVKRKGDNCAPQDYLPCCKCYLFVTKAELYKHSIRCGMVCSTLNAEVNCMLTSSLLLYGAGGQNLFGTSTRGINSLHHDRAGVTAKLDHFITTYGLLRWQNMGKSGLHDLHTDLRLLGTVLIETRKLTGKDNLQLEGLIVNVSFDLLVKAGIIIDTQVYKVNKSFRLGRLLEQLGALKMGEAIKERDGFKKDDAEKFSSRCQTDWLAKTRGVAPKVRKPPRQNFKELKAEATGSQHQSSGDSNLKESRVQVDKGTNDNHHGFQPQSSADSNVKESRVQLDKGTNDNHEGCQPKSQADSNVKESRVQTDNDPKDNYDSSQAQLAADSNVKESGVPADRDTEVNKDGSQPQYSADSNVKEGRVQVDKDTEDSQDGSQAQLAADSNVKESRAQVERDTEVNQDGSQHQYSADSNVKEGRVQTDKDTEDSQDGSQPQSSADSNVKKSRVEVDKDTEDNHDDTLSQDSLSVDVEIDSEEEMDESVLDLTEEAEEDSHEEESDQSSKRRRGDTRFDGVTVQAGTAKDFGISYHSKRQGCYICNRLVSKLPSHFSKKHRNSPIYQKIMELSQTESGIKDLITTTTTNDSLSTDITATNSRSSTDIEREKRVLFDQMRNLGNFFNNLKVLKQNKGLLVVKRGKKISVAEDYLPCRHCYAFVKKRDMYYHQHRCMFRFTGIQFESPDQEKDIRMGYQVVCMLVRFGPGKHPWTENLPEDYVENVLLKLPDDEISRTVVNEIILCQYGRESYGGVIIADDLCCQLRVLGQILMTLRTLEGDDDIRLEEFLTSAKFDNCIDAVKQLQIGGDKKLDIVTKLDFGIIAGQALRDLAVFKSQKADDAKDPISKDCADHFIGLFDNEWREKMKVWAQEVTLLPVQSTNLSTTNQAGDSNYGSYPKDEEYVKTNKGAETNPWCIPEHSITVNTSPNQIDNNGGLSGQLEHVDELADTSYDTFLAQKVTALPGSVNVTSNYETSCHLGHITSVSSNNPGVNDSAMKEIETALGAIRYGQIVDDLPGREAVGNLIAVEIEGNENITSRVNVATPTAIRGQDGESDNIEHVVTFHDGGEVEIPGCSYTEVRLANGDGYGSSYQDGIGDVSYEKKVSTPEGTSKRSKQQQWTTDEERIMYELFQHEIENKQMPLHRKLVHASKRLEGRSVFVVRSKLNSIISNINS